MSLKRPLATIAFVAASSMALAACGGSGDAAEPDADASTETVSFTWDRNIAGEDEEPEYESTTAEVPVNPETVVTFDMASLDTVGALGGEVAGAPLESVPEYLAGYLSEDAFNAGTLFEADLVEIEAQQPDLILISGRSSALWEDLNEIAPTVDLSPAGTYLETLERNTDFIGEVFDAEEEASAAVDDLLAQIEEVRTETAELGTGLGVMVSGGSLSALAASGGTEGGFTYRSGIMYDVFGVQPVIEDIQGATHGEPVSFEFVLEQNPDHLFVIDRDQAIGTEDAEAAAAVLDNDIIDATTAASNDQIHYLNPVAWYIVYGGLDTTQVMIDDVRAAVA
ncbi:siderophore ABC transporter substrate-binding protein [Ruania halotolerans]|uniref:siderophore ABC transporter substrate-binding protein n=1 Tax=Ruania halotolerans TaxID=2897773 RepID=UPI001E2872B1|nr:ABC transporter substrate-binding protein [Ruania halotolerans]UFU07576.1 ABC transporter substrate-binding protein [Ruania halotolerans]